MISIPDTNFREIFLWVLQLRKKYRVEGHSMMPLLKPGDQIMVKKVKKDELSVNDIVIFKHPFDKKKKLVKQIDKIYDKNRLVVSGINKEDSLDSRSLGIINKKLIIGRLSSLFKG